MTTPKHNGKPVKSGHYYGGGGGGGCYSEGFPIHLAGDPIRPAPAHRRTRRYWVAEIAVIAVFLVIGFASECADAGERWDRMKDWGRENWKPAAACVAGGVLAYQLTKPDRRTAKTITLHNGDVEPPSYAGLKKRARGMGAAAGASCYLVLRD